MAEAGAATVLVVDDDQQLRRAMDVNLRIRGYTVIQASTGEAALRLAATHRPDLVILDLGLPGIDGVEVITGLRQYSEVPIMVLSAREGERQKVAALDAGADDYVTKPFGMDEAIARVRVLLRRRTAEQTDGGGPLLAACMAVDLAGRSVRLRREGVVAEEVHLTPSEWTLLELLARNAGRLVTRRAVTTAMWGSDAIDPSTIRVHLGKLRHKLELDPTRPCCLLTETGMGYRFKPVMPLSPTG